MAVLKTEYVVIGGLVLLGLFMRSFKDRLITALAKFIPSVEGFRSTPYWDVSRYSWGYGTKAPGQYGQITREQAFNEMVSYLLSDYSILSKKITRSLNVNQWAALLSFSYNLGYDDALDLVPLINQGDDAALQTQWRRYVHAGGVVNADLVERREKEIALWNS
jgi:GH24 family phage-related lysozyme (muramidase)